MFSSKPENLHIIERVTKYLAENSLGAEAITYRELSRVAGIDLRKRRDLLHKARERAEKQCSCIFEAVYSIGIRRLPINETSHVGSAAIGSTRRKTKRAITRMGRVSSNEMSADARQLTALKVAHLNVLHGLADNRKTATFVAPATADPFAAKKATGI